MKRYLDRLLPAVIIAVISWTLYANSQGSNSPGSRVTVVNPLSNPAIVTCANCGQISVGSISGTFTSSPTTVTIANSAAFPAIVSLVNVPSPLTVTCANCATGTVGGSLLVTIANSAAFPGIVSLVNVPSPITVTCSNCTTSNATISGTITVQNFATGTSLNVLDTNSAALLASVQSSVPAGGNTIGAVSLINQPIIVTCTNCGAATISGLNVTGPFNVTITNSLTLSNTAAAPAIVSLVNVPNPVTVTFGNINVSTQPSLVTIANTATVPAVVSMVNVPTITISNPVLTSNVTVTNTNPNGQATMTNSQSVAIASDQSALTINNNSSQFVTITNVLTVSNTAAAPVIISLVNIPTGSGPLAVTCGNCLEATDSFSSMVTVTNSVVSPANVGLVASGAASGGLTLITGYNQLTSVNSLKTTPGKLYKVVCLNPNIVSAYLEVYNLTPTSVDQQLNAARVGGNANVARPLLAYGVISKSNFIAINPIGDQFTVAMSAVATLTISGALPPPIGLDCSFSIN